MKTKNKFSIVLTIAGIFLIISSAALFCFTNYLQTKDTQAAQQIAVTIEKMMPEKSVGFSGEINNDEMAVFQIDGIDFIGTISIPGNEKNLPVAAYYNKESYTTNKYPCRYSGNLYDNTLVIGGNESNGQFAMLKTLTSGQKIEITDVSGRVFSYRIKAIEQSKNATKNILCDKKYHLTLFVKDKVQNEYIIVRCNKEN